MNRTSTGGTNLFHDTGNQPKNSRFTLPLLALAVKLLGGALPLLDRAAAADARSYSSVVSVRVTRPLPASQVQRP